MPSLIAPAAPVVTEPSSGTSPGGDSPAPLTFAQERFWRRRGLPGPVSSVPVVLRLEGSLDFVALCRALAAVVERHEALRTTFAEVGGGAIQVVGPAAGPPPPLIDLAALPSTLRAREVERTVLRECGTSFDLVTGPLARMRLFRCAAEEHVLVCVFHHVAFDGWSGAVFTQELLALYGTFRSGTAAPLPPPVQVRDHARWQRHPARAAGLERQRAFWRRSLSGAVAPDLEALAPRHAMGSRSRRAASEPVVLAAELCHRARAVGTGCGATLFITLLAAFQASLARATGQSDITVTTLYANRTRPGLTRLIGSFFTSLPLRVRIDGTSGFRGLLAQAREVALAAYDNADVLFEEILEELGVAGADPAAAFRVRFALQAPPSTAANGCGLTVAEVPIDAGRTRQDLALLLSARGEGAAGRLRYDTGVLTAGAVASLRDGFLQVLGYAVLDPDRPLDDLFRLAAADCDDPS